MLEPRYWASYYAPALAELSERDLKRPDVKKPRLAGPFGGF